MKDQLTYVDHRPKVEGADESLLKVLTELTAQGFTCDNSERLHRDVEKHVLSCDRLILAQDGRKVVGYTAIADRKLDRLRVCHLEGIIVNPKLHRTGVSRQLLKASINSEQTVLALHTQHKAMEALAEKLSKSDIALALLVAELIGTRNLVELPSGPIDRCRYEGYLYGDVVSFLPLAIMREGFEADRGDAIVYAGYLIKGENE